MSSIVEAVSADLSIPVKQIESALQLFNEGATVPFIARYRKERTAGLTDVELLDIQKSSDKFKQLEDRKLTVLKSIDEQGFLTDDLKNKISSSAILSELEDIYLPFKPKRKTRASIAKAKGLEPLAKMIMSEKVDFPEQLAKQFISSAHDVTSIEDALQGARDIIAEWINEKAGIRNSLRRVFEREAEFVSKVSKGKEIAGQKYSSYFDWKEKANRAPSHRVLAMFRGEEEGFLKIKVQPDLKAAIQNVVQYNVRNKTGASKQKELAIKDAVKRLLFPSLESEYRSVLKQQADESAIRVFLIIFANFYWHHHWERRVSLPLTLAFVLAVK